MARETPGKALLAAHFGLFYANRGVTATLRKRGEKAYHWEKQ